MILRQFKKTDLDCIKQIVEDAWKPVYDHRKSRMDEDIFKSIWKEGAYTKSENLSDWCVQNPYNIKIAEVDGEIAGVITWEEYNKETVELSNNAVSPKFQRQGVATKMYQWFLFEMKRRGYLYTFVFTGLDEAHESSRAAYKKMGFSMPIELVRYYKKL